VVIGAAAGAKESIEVLIITASSLTRFLALLTLLGILWLCLAVFDLTRRAI
jgi:hypothetical protein